MKLMHTIIAFLDRLNTFLDKFSVSVSWIFLAIITGVNILAVLYRYVLNDPLGWSEEVSVSMMLWMAFLIMPMAYRKGYNVSMMALRNMLRKNRIEYGIRVAMHIVVLVMSSYCVKLGLQMYEQGKRMQLPALEIPNSYIYIILPIAFVLLGVAVIEMIFRDGVGIIDPELAHDAGEEDDY